MASELPHDDDSFASRVALLCGAAFGGLPKSGKPRANEWTVLSGVVQCVMDTASQSESINEGARLEHNVISEPINMHSSSAQSSLRLHSPSDISNKSTKPCISQVNSNSRFPYQLKVVSLGTGSKCLGTSKWCPKGSLVHDSHAEVVAKRSFQLYLADEIEAASKGQASVVEVVGADSIKVDANATDSDELTSRTLPDGIAGGPQSHLHSTTNNLPMYKLKKGISFHMYISHTPCGDCSIFPKQDGESNLGNLVPLSVADVTALTPTELDTDSYNSKLIDDVREPFLKKFKTNKSTVFTGDLNKGCTSPGSDNNSGVPGTSLVVQSTTSGAPNTSTPDIHRTGAKCAVGEAADDRLPGSLYHTVGLLRTKPGRGDPSLSHCCSDKLLRWSVMGIQGALLMTLLQQPVYLDTVTIGSCAFNRDAMERGLYLRFEEKFQSLKLDGGFKQVRMKVLKCDVSFGRSRDAVRKIVTSSDAVVPCSASISWYPGCGNKTHVLVDGRKIGVTKKVLGTEKSQVPICRYQKMKRLVGLIQLTGAPDHWSPVNEEGLADLQGVNNSLDLSIAHCYNSLKMRSRIYCKVWQHLKTCVLMNWTTKPDGLQDFKI